MSDAIASPETSVPTGTRSPAAPAAAWASISDLDPELWSAMEAERHRQADKIELIASENYVYAAVLEAQGSWLTNKYAEGLPGKRYYGGCEYVDIAENLAARPGAGALPRTRTTSTSSRTRAPRPTWPPTSRSCSRVTGSSA